MRAWLEYLRFHLSPRGRFRSGRSSLLGLERLEDRCVPAVPVWNTLTTDVGSFPEGGGTVNLIGSFTDTGTGETFALSIDWGDGTPLQTVNLGTAMSFTSIPHVYTPFVPTGMKDINVSVIDS